MSRRSDLSEMGEVRIKERKSKGKYPVEIIPRECADRKCLGS